MAAQFEGTPAGVGFSSPSVGQHNDEILHELGLADDIEALRAAGILS